jgi:hypothetical protein
MAQLTWIDQRLIGAISIEDVLESQQEMVAALSPEFQALLETFMNDAANTDLPLDNRISAVELANKIAMYHMSYRRAA